MMQQFIELKFRFSREDIKYLDALVKNGKFPNREETVHQALAFLEWCLGQTVSGAKLCLETAEGVSQIVFPYWEYENEKKQSEGNTALPVSETKAIDENFLKEWLLKMPDHNAPDEE